MSGADASSVCWMAIRAVLSAGWRRLQVSLTGLGDQGCQVSSSVVVGPPFDAPAFSEKLVADDRPTVLPRLRPAFEAPHLDEAPGHQGDEARPAGLGDLLPRWRLRPADLPERRGGILQVLEHEVFPEVESLAIAHNSRFCRARPSVGSATVRAEVEQVRQTVRRATSSASSRSSEWASDVIGADARATSDAVISSSMGR